MPDTEDVDRCPECGELVPDDCECGVTVCTDPECGAMFSPGEEGFGNEECFDCGAETYETT